MNTQLHCYGVTDIGCRRKQNEDQYLLSGLNHPIVANANHERSDSSSLVTNQTMLMAVADGLGGRKGGAIASELAVDSLGCFAQKNETNFRKTQSKNLQNLIRNGFETAGQTIRRLSDDHPTRNRMATTLTAALVRYPDLVVGHVGDSRCYLFRNNRLLRLTCDHTVAELYRERGELSNDEFENSPMHHVLWNCIGGDEKMFKVETSTTKLEVNDWILLCTDGLIRHVSDSDISVQIASSQSPQQLCKSLRALAIERGGNDNITIVACNWKQPWATQVQSEPNWKCLKAMPFSEV
ncbi:MAG: PP2C family serine/threonine-protein phosphatase [Mariniblastus sp.]